MILLHGDVGAALVGAGLIALVVLIPTVILASLVITRSSFYQTRISPLGPFLRVVFVMVATGLFAMGMVIVVFTALRYFT
jgi:hypothetical protein